MKDRDDKDKFKIKIDLDSASDYPTKSKLKPGLRSKNKDFYTVWDTF